MTLVNLREKDLLPAHRFHKAQINAHFYIRSEARQHTPFSSFFVFSLFLSSFLSKRERETSIFIYQQSYFHLELI